MKKKIILITIIIINILIITLGINRLLDYIKVKNATIKVVLKDNLNLNFNETKKVSDYIESINGTIIDDYIINSKKIGTKEIKFEFINDENIKVKYSYNINVIDITPPVIWLGKTYSILKDSEDNIIDSIMCGDDTDSNPKCFIEGTYDLSTVGKYPLKFIAIDKSGNKKEEEFTLSVYEQSNSKTYTKTNTRNTNFSYIKEQYKNDKTKIGIDVSAWQDKIDFEALKNAGVEFIFIRVGGTLGTDGEYFLDQEFIRNIEEANKYEIPVGIYFYSYANTKDKAIENANWVLKQIKGYKIDLPIAFDWEEWSNFNEYNLSFYELTNMAEEFIKVVEKAGYKGMLYSSKSYLESIWLKNDLDIWLAHYTENTDYKGNYSIWQLTNQGKIDGINGDVDINIMYLD